MTKTFTLTALLLISLKMWAQPCIYNAYEGFGYTNNLPLNGLGGSSGWASAWAVQNENSTVPGYQTTNASPMAFGTLQELGRYASGGASFLTAGRRFNTTEAGPFAAYVGAGGDAIGDVATGNTLFVSVMLRKEANNSDEVFITLHADNIPYCPSCSSQRIGAGYYGTPSDVSGQRRWSLEVGNTIIPTAIPVVVGQTAFLVLRIVFNSGSTDAALFVDPAQLGSGSLGAASASQSSASAFEFRSLAVKLGNAAGSGSIDEIRLAPTYACVAPDANITVDAPPTAIILASPISGQAPMTVDFDGSTSSDPEGQTLSYAWNFGDGTPGSSLSTISHNYTFAAGALPVTLTVSNPSGQQITATTTITVLNALNTFSCQPTITSLAKATCGQSNGHIQIGLGSGVSATLLQGGNPLAVQPNNNYSGLAPGNYTVETSGTNGCSDIVDIVVLVDSTTCPGWELDPCAMTVGMNLTGLADWSTERPFKNRFKHVRPDPLAYTASCFCFSVPGMLEEVTFGPEGYPTHIPQTTTLGQALVKYVISSDEGNLLSGQEMVVLYDGTGTVQIGGDAAGLTSIPGRFTFTPGSGNIWIEIIQSNVNNPVRNIRLLRPADEFADLSNDPFYSVFIDRIEPYSTLRFMDWGSTNNNPMVNWADRTTTDHFTYGTLQGVPYEMMIQLANLTDKDIWVCVPHMASDAFITEMATLFRDNLEPERTVYLEYSNEVWNFLFQQSTYNDQNRPQNLMYGRAMAEKAHNVFTLWHSVFSGQTERVQRVLGLQGGFNFLNDNILAQLDPNDWDLGSPSHYFGLDHDVTGNPVLSGTSTVADVMLNTRNAFNIFKETVKQDYRNVQLYGKQVVTYEGGQHFVGNSVGIPYPYQQSMWDAQYSTSMYDMYRTMHDSIASWGCQLATNFSNASEQESVYGSWGVLTHIDQAGPYIQTAPKYQALLDIVAGCDLLPVSNPSPETDHTTLTVWPNPNTGQFSIAMEEPTAGPTEKTIHDLYGRLVHREVNTNNRLSISLPSGIYILSIKVGGDEVRKARVVVL